MIKAIDRFGQYYPMYVHAEASGTRALNLSAKQSPRLSVQEGANLEAQRGFVTCRYKCGDEKGLLLEGLVRKYQPLTVVELGSFLGYSATRIGSRLPKVRAQRYGPGVVDRGPSHPGL